MENILTISPELTKMLDRERPEWIPDEKWQKLRRKEKVFIILWRRGWADATITKALFFNSASGVRMLRKRVLGKIK